MVQEVSDRRRKGVIMRARDIIAFDSKWAMLVESYKLWVAMEEGLVEKTN